MADVGDHSAQAFRRITRTSTLYLPARSLTGDQITDRPDLAKAHLADKLTLAPQAHLDAVTHHDLRRVVDRGRPAPPAQRDLPRTITAVLDPEGILDPDERL